MVICAANRLQSLPNSCYRCQRLGHVVANCPIPIRRLPQQPIPLISASCLSSPLSLQRPSPLQSIMLSANDNCPLGLSDSLSRLAPHTSSCVTPRFASMTENSPCPSVGWAILMMKVFHLCC
ncbi:hypothetical protein O6H91_13G018800 [Diphasiastrum complanatum]|uniref:Uncharacterized protein n=1 Tax=Diphasiastrum complanatum TaxID=34168 RepID=A0ACC2BSP7_DIPCM|nr:hypothetical protein O6H91_13G018800 [Diphasiastrum complanatum]